MADAPVITQLQNLGQQLASQNATQFVTKYKGDEKKFKTWLKEVEKFCILNRNDDDEHKKRLAYQTSEGPVSDFIERYMRANANCTFAELKDELKARFGTFADGTQALTFLRRVKQRREESIQMFGERILGLAEDAYPGADINEPFITRQLIDFFVDGLMDSSIARKVIRETPENFNRAVVIATNEQNMLVRFNLRGRQEEAMEINAVKSTSNRTQTTKCYRCHKPGHIAKYCRNKNTWPSNIICFHCKQPGHIKRVCPDRNNQQGNDAQPK